MWKLIAYPENEEKAKALKVIMKALKIPFEEAASPYSPHFVEKIRLSEAQFEAGNFKAIKTEDLWK